MRVRTQCGVLVVVALVMMTAGVAHSSQQVELLLTDGRQISGELIAETDDTVTVRVAGVESRFRRGQIEEMRPRLDPLERYEERRAEIEAEDYHARYELARGLLSERTVESYRIILRETESILEDRPDVEEVRLLRRIAANRLEMMERDRPEPVEQADGERPEPRVPQRREMPPLLTEEQINLIKVFEVDLEDDPVVVVPRETINAVIEAYRDDPEFQRYLGRDGERRFRTLSGAQQLEVLFNLRAREFYQDVVVRTEPEPLREFRTLVHRNYAVRYCGSCHTEGRAEGLDLITRRTNYEPVVYTNLMILRRMTVDSTPMLSRANAMESPLLQYGLPRADALRPHPEVRGWRPSFSGPNDPRLIRIAEWMGTLYGEVEDYPIDYTPHSLATAEEAAEVDAPEARE